MDFYKKLKSFLGLNNHENSHENNPFSSPPDIYRENKSTYDPPRNFNVFSDPLYIHKYFEEQMNEMLKNFGFHDFGNNFFSDQFNVPAIENYLPSSELRDQYLKPGYENRDIIENQQKVDQDMDGKLDVGDLDSVFGTKPGEGYQRYMETYSQFTKMKTVTRPDGSIETERTVRDHLGNEETTIKRRIGDQEYTIIKRKDKEGREETIENLHKKDIDKFITPKDNFNNDNEVPHNWFPFDKFFKQN